MFQEAIDHSRWSIVYGRIGHHSLFGFDIFIIPCSVLLYVTGLIRLHAFTCVVSNLGMFRRQSSNFDTIRRLNKSVWKEDAEGRSRFEIQCSLFSVLF